MLVHVSEASRDDVLGSSDGKELLAPWHLGASSTVVPALGSFQPPARTILLLFREGFHLARTLREIGTQQAATKRSKHSDVLPPWPNAARETCGSGYRGGPLDEGAGS